MHYPALYFIPRNLQRWYNQKWFWLLLSLLFAVLCGAIALNQVLSSNYIIQDDARHHVFWMHRFSNPEVFPDNLIADYFQTVAPLGYRGLYQVLNAIGIEPLLANKLLPLVLGLVMTVYCFEVSYQLLPVPLVGFLSSVLLNQIVWAEDNLISATPRAFVYPLFLAFLYYGIRRSPLPFLTVIALQGLFYPQYVLIYGLASALGLWRWHGETRRLQWNPNRNERRLFVLAIGVSVGILLIFRATSSGFGPVVGVEQARSMLEYSEVGRTPFFGSNRFCFWMTRKNSGILALQGGPRDCGWMIESDHGILPLPLNLPLLVWISILLPLCYGFPRQFPLIRLLSPQFKTLGRVWLACLILFFTAHLVLFRLHFPARYTVHSLRILLALVAGITICIFCQGLLQMAQQSAHQIGVLRAIKWAIAYVIVSIICLSYALFPFEIEDFATRALVEGKHVELYQFLENQPEDIVVASIAKAADQIPTFAKRSVLVNRENAMPFHMGFYNQFQQQVLDILKAQYTSRPDILAGVIEQYGIDFWLLDKDAFSPSYVKEAWTYQYQPITRQIAKRLEAKKRPLLRRLARECKVYKGDNLKVLDGRCLVREARAIGDA